MISAALATLATGGRFLWWLVGLGCVALALAAWARLTAARRSDRGEKAYERPDPADEPVLQSWVENFLNALPVGAMIINAAGRISSFNRAAGEIFGISPDNALGRALIETVRSFELDRRVQAALQEGTASAIELTFEGGSQRRLHITIQALSASKERHDAFIVIEDRTPLHELQTVRRDFVSNVSHELRTPLASMKIMVETLQSGVDATANADFLQDIARETDRMIDLVEDLLDLARLESGKFELRIVAFDFADLCREAIAIRESGARACGVRLRYMGPQAISFKGDRGKLFQVLANLLDNALRYTPRGGRVEVSLSSAQTLDLVVEDSGAGMSSETLAHVFERFYVGDRSRAKTKGGTGLGLAIVKHIVEAHGGSVRVQSEVNQGTRFTCSFPKAQLNAAGAER